MQRYLWIVGALVGGLLLGQGASRVNAQNANSQRVWTKPAGSVLLYAGTQTATVTAAALAASTAVSELSVQCDPDNAVDCFVGTSAAQPIQLQPGQSFNVPVNNLAQLYVKTASSTALVNYFARH